MDNNEKMLLAKAEDLYRLCEKYQEPRFSGFLNETEQVLIKEEVGSKIGFNTVYSGGYEDSERCMMGVFPEWHEEYIFPITLLKITKGYEKQLTHRDYLGTVLSLGIERYKIGDILVNDVGAYMFVEDDISDYILFNITKIANCGVKVEKVDINADILPKKEFKTVSAISASKRLDAILAGALNLSRREVSSLINSGKVSVNHKEISDVSFNVKENDLMSVRGHGRIIIEKFGNFTGSGRIHILLKKYK